MKLYKIEMCLGTAFRKLKKFKLKEYNVECPTLFIEAEDPDDACNKAFYNLATILIKQDSSTEMLRLIADILYDIKVTSIKIP